MELKDSFEKMVDYCNQLGWFEIKENDFRQVELMNYAHPFIITVTGLAYNEITIECTISARHQLTRFHKKTIQKMILGDLLNKKISLKYPLEWVLEDNGDICWILKGRFLREMFFSDANEMLQDLLLIANSSWGIGKRLCRFISLIDSKGIVLPVEGCSEKMRSISAAIKYLELLNYTDIDRILIGVFLYNSPYRSILRDKGIESLINYICEQEPELLSREALWNCVKNNWDVLCYSFGNLNIKLIYTIDTFPVFGCNINGLNETINMLEYNTSGIESIFKDIRQDKNGYVNPLLGNLDWIRGEYHFHHRTPKVVKSGVHVAEYSNEFVANPITQLCDDTYLLVFKKKNINLKEIKKLNQLDENVDLRQIEALDTKQIPALCFFKGKTYMLLIASND